MSNQRIEPVDSPYPDSLQSSFDVVMPRGMPPLNIFRTIGRNPRVLSRMVRGGLLDKGSITIAQRELVILRACAVCGAEYEWGVHVAAYTAKAKFSKKQISDTCSSVIDIELWSEEQRNLIRMVDELHSQATISDSMWEKLARDFAPEQLVELVMLAGLYHAISFVVNGLRISNEAFAPQFPGNPDLKGGGISYVFQSNL